MDINSLKTYLAKNRHLPGMDSADEIKEKGHIDMTKLTLNSLEKLEELYLYVIVKVEKCGGLYLIPELTP